RPTRSAAPFPYATLFRSDIVLGDFCIPSLEIAGPGGHWVEVSRALGRPSTEVARMLDAYREYYEVAREALHPGATSHDVHRAVSDRKSTRLNSRHERLSY